MSENNYSWSLLFTDAVFGIYLLTNIRSSRGNEYSRCFPVRSGTRAECRKMWATHTWLWSTKATLCLPVSALILQGSIPFTVYLVIHFLHFFVFFVSDFKLLTMAPKHRVGGLSSASRGRKPGYANGEHGVEDELRSDVSNSPVGREFNTNQ